MTKGISVVICCYNSMRRISDTLLALGKQRLKISLSWEIILVDNASTDHTVRTAVETWKQLSDPAPLHIVYEAKQGLTHARKTGIHQSRYDYILFCDDDNWLNEDYIEKAFLTMEANPKVAALGGIGTAVFETSEPFWFKDYQEAYAVGSQALTRENGKQLSLYGAGMVIRKKMYERLLQCGFSELLNDRTGNSLSSSGDTELTNAFTIAGYELMASEELRFKHYLTANRLHPQYLLRLFRAFGADGPIRNIYYSFQTSKKHFWLLRFWWLHVLLALFRTFKYLVTPPKKGARKLYWYWSLAYLKKLMFLIASYNTLYISLSRFQQNTRKEADPYNRLLFTAETSIVHQSPASL